MQQAEIQVSSHHFTVKHPTRGVLKVLYQLSSDFTQMGIVYDPKYRKRRWAPTKTFGLRRSDGQEFRFHIGQLTRFYELLHKQVGNSEYVITKTKPWAPSKVDYKLRSHYKLRTDPECNQEEAVQFILDDGKYDGTAHYPILCMPMGSGKSFTSLYTAAKLGNRICCSVVSKYVQKWYKDIPIYYDIDPKTIMTVQGTEELLDLLYHVKDCKENNKPLPNVYIFSLNTLANWYKMYLNPLEYPKLAEFPCQPYELHEFLDAGTNISDETHEHLHSVYKLFCFMNTEKSISLSGTFLTKDTTEAKIQNMMFPMHKRFLKIKMKQYIKTYACSYQIVNHRQLKIKTSEPGQNTYSHIAYERFILGHKTLRKQYLDMIIDLLASEYHEKKAPKDRAAIYVSSMEMAKIVTEMIQKRFPQYDTRMFLEPDPLENMQDPDIRVTTVLSGGTAHDVADLRVVILTICIDSPRSNLQVLGRLRELKDRDTRFYYLYCGDIPKQVEYHHNKKHLFKPKVLSQGNLFLKPLMP